MTYTPSGSRTDLEINPAIDVRAEISERETERKPDAMTWAGDSYARTDSAGSIELTNRKREAIEVEVRRSVLGLVDQVGQEGAMLQEGLAELWRSQELPEWWSWYSWPYWWQRWNGVGRFTWTVKLEPGESTTLEAQWHYFWR